VNDLDNEFYTIDEIDELQRALLFRLSVGDKPFYASVAQHKLDQEHIELRACRVRDQMIDIFRFRVVPPASTEPQASVVSAQGMIDIPNAPIISGWANIIKETMRARGE
jgi:hypothetical protein